MGLKHVMKLAWSRPSREEARFTLRYLRYYDPRTYRALNKFFETKYGMSCHESFIYFATLREFKYVLYILYI